MRFSVIIPARNEEGYVAAGVRALQHQTVPRESYEVIVVDNNSTDRTTVVAGGAGADKVVFEKILGTNIARQRGVSESTGEILAFLDADSVPPPDWLENIERGLSEPDVVAISGPYDEGFRGYLLFLQRIGERFFVYLGGLLYLFFGKRAGVLIGGNMGIWRSAVEKIGGLPPLKFWGDDAAIAMLLSRQVGRVVFNPHLLVKSSPRRVKREGPFALQFRYAKMYFRIYFRNEKEWARLNKESEVVIRETSNHRAHP